MVRRPDCGQKEWTSAFGSYPRVERQTFDLVVISPGVPLSVEPARSAQANGVTLIGELELAYTFARAPWWPSPALMVKQPLLP
ncbi:MAG: hypothetical protein RQM92_03915 [Candidatus Syntrophopropionicum ammoniitolerans]